MSTKTAITIAGTNYNQIDKIWKVQDSGGLGCAFVQFDISTAAALPVGQRWYVAIADDKNFTANVEVKTVLVVSNMLTTRINLAANSSQFLALLQSNVAAGAVVAANNVGISLLPSFVSSAANAYLEVNANQAGMVITRLAGTASIAAPLEGMFVFDTTNNFFKIYNGTIWRPIKTFSTYTKFCN